MYCYYPDSHHSCDCRQPKPPSQAATTQPPDELGAGGGGGSKGMWFYVCYPHTHSYGPHHYPSHVDHLHRPPCMTGCCCCCRRHVSTDDVETPDLVVTNNISQKKEPKKCFTDDKPTVRVYCKAKTDFSLTIRAGQVILVPTSPHDHHQHWIKDETIGINVKDEEGHSSFALVNKATGQAMKHSIGEGYPVQLTNYNPDKFDKSVLWTLSKKMFRPIGHFDLHLDAENKDGKGVKDGARIILWDWVDGANQKWRIMNY